MMGSWRGGARVSVGGEKEGKEKVYELYMYNCVSVDGIVRSRQQWKQTCRVVKWLGFGDIEKARPHTSFAKKAGLERHEIGPGTRSRQCKSYGTYPSAIVGRHIKIRGPP